MVPSYWVQKITPIKISGTDGPRYKRGHSHFGEKITPEKKKNLRLRWTCLGKKLPLSISGKDGPIRVKNHLWISWAQIVPLGWKPTSKQKRTSQMKICIRKSKQLRKRGKTTNWENNLSMHTKSCLYVKSYVLGTDGPTWVKHHP